MNSYILAIDIGTTHVKGLAVFTTGLIGYTGSEKCVSYFPYAGHVEQDPGEILQAVRSIMHQTLKEMSGKEILGISFSSALHSILAVDRAGIPLTRAITWADTRSIAQSQRLKKNQSADLIYRMSGTPIHPMSPLCKIAWIKENQPDLFARTYKFISIKEYVLYELTGEYVVDYSVASASGLFNNLQLDWLDEALAFSGIKKSHVSKPVSPYTMLKLQDNDFQCPVIIGAGDGCLANLGSNAIHPGDLALTIGTSGAARMVSDKLHYDQDQRVFNYLLDDKTFVAGGATNSGGGLLAWFNTTFGNKVETENDFIDEAFSVSSSEGLIFLPYVYGERAPSYDPLARGVFFGIAAHHTKAHFKRALIEGINFAMLSIVDVLREVVGPVSKVYATGGFVMTDQWVQSLADGMGLPIYIDRNTDASAKGAALQGFSALGIQTKWHEDEVILKTFEPNMDHHQRIRKSYAIFHTLNKQLEHEFPKLQNL